MILRCALLLALVVNQTAPAQAKPSATPVAPLERPTEVHRWADTMLRVFGQLVGSYNAVNRASSPLVGIDPIGNETGNDKFPNDSGHLVRTVLERIGQLPSVRTLPGGFGPRAGPPLTALPVFVEFRPQPPAPALRVTGTIERATEVVTREKNGRLDARVGGGRTPFDAQLAAERESVLTDITLNLVVEQPNQIGFPGANVRYRVRFEKQAKGGSFAIYIAGTGVGAGRKITITQDPADALYDVVAVAAVHALGQALNIPYHRCDPIFQTDASLRERVAHLYRREPREGLEALLKRFLVVDGLSASPDTAVLTPADQALILLLMKNAGIDSTSEDAHERLALRFWDTLDFRAAAPRIDRMTSDLIRAQNEAQLRRERAEAEATIAPSAFGWSDSVRIVVVDASRVEDGRMFHRIVGDLTRLDARAEVRHHPNRRGILAIRTTATETAIHSAIQRSREAVEPIWIPSPTTQLRLIPVSWGERRNSM